jgi:uncharacterized membrane protein
VLNKKALLDYEKSHHKFLDFILRHNHNIKELLLSKTFLLAIFSGLSSFLLLSKAQSLGEISVIYPLSNLSFVFSIIFGYLILKETLNKKELLSLLIVFAGIFMMIMSKSEATMLIFSKLNLIIFTVLIMSIITVSSLSVKWLKKDIKTIVHAVNSGLFLGNGYLFMKLMSMNIISADYPAVADNLMDMSILFPFLSFMFFAIASFLVLQLAFKNGKVSVVAPIAIVLSTSIPFIGGYFVYNEFMSIAKLIGFGMIIIGIIVLSIYNEND